MKRRFTSRTKWQTIALLQRTLDTITSMWLDDVARMSAETAKAERAQKVAETRLRDAENRLDTVRARVSQADINRLLTHRGHWPQDVIDAVAHKLTGMPPGFEVGGHGRWLAISVLDVAARAMHHDHVHVALRSTEAGEGYL